MEYKPEFKLKGKRLLVEVTTRAFDKNGIVLPESKISYYDTMKVVKVGDGVEDIKIGDEIIVDIMALQRIQIFTLDSREGLELTIDLDGYRDNPQNAKLNTEKYKYRLVNYNDIVVVKSN